MLVSLKVHPDTPSLAIQRIEVEVSRVTEGDLKLAYRVFGHLDRVRVPDLETATPGRTDGLWRSTCFEAFVQSVGSAGYLEFNFSLANQWAAYWFDGERTGMRPASIEPRTIEGRLGSDQIELGIDIEPGRLARPDLPAPDWRLGLSAVIEDVDGSLSYWALVHPSAKPDFHHPDSFALTLPPPEPA